VVRESRSVAKTSGCDEDSTLGSRRVSSTDLWKTMGTAGLTCPQAATYRGSVGVEPAVSCCAPCGTMFVGGLLTGFLTAVCRTCAKRQIYQWICRQT